MDLRNPLKCILRIISLWIHWRSLKMHSNRSQEDLHIRCEILHAFCLRSRHSLPLPRLHWASNADASLRVIACSCQNNITLGAVRTIIFLRYFAAFCRVFFYAHSKSCMSLLPRLQQLSNKLNFLLMRVSLKKNGGMAGVRVWKSGS